MIRKLALAAAGLACLAVATCTSTPPTDRGFAAPVERDGWGLAVHEGGDRGFSAGPECWDGANTDGQDGTVDHLVVGDDGHFVIEPHRLAEVDGDVVTRTRVTYTYVDSGARPGSAGYWYSLRHYGSRTGRLTQSTTQAWNLHLGGASSPEVAEWGTLPSVESGPIRWTIWVSFSVDTQRAAVTCSAEVVVYHPDDPGIPDGAVRARDVPHPVQHQPIEPFATVEADQYAYVYPSGPVLGEPECDGHDDTPAEHDAGPRGQIRHEPDLAGLDDDLLTQDTWATYDVGAGPQFSWRERVPDLPNRREYAQVGQSFNVVLPDGQLVQDYQPATVRLTSHWHHSPEPSDTEGMICDGAVVVR